MATYSFLFRNPFPWLVALGSFLAFTYYSSGFGFLTVFLTSSTLILCPVIVSFSKPYERKMQRREEFSSSPSKVESEEQIYAVLPLPEGRTEDSYQNLQGKVAQIMDEQVSKLEMKEDKNSGDHLLSSLQSLSDKIYAVLPNVTQMDEQVSSKGSPIFESLSESESFDHTTSSDDYSENDWILRENLSYSTHCSDGSISDEESLIEIELPTGYYGDFSKKQEQSWYGFQKKNIMHQNWIEMLNEVNEEENLIEIDIGMGCIKFSRFEIEA